MQEDPAEPAAASGKRPAPSNSAAAGLTTDTATRTLLRALRTLHLWDTRQTTQPQVPQALQCLAPGQPGTIASSLAAAAAAVVEEDEEVQEVMDLTGDDDDGDNSCEQMQQFLARQLYFIVGRYLRSSKSGASTGSKRIKIDLVDNVE